MKKVEEVEVEYVKKTTTLFVALVCLVAGFAIGILYMQMNSNSRSERRSPVVQQQSAPQQQQQAPIQQPEVNPEQTAAIMQLKQILSTDSKNAEAWARLGHAYFDTQQFDEAIDAYQKHLELNPENADVWTDMGVMYRRTKRPDRAIECFDKAIAADPKHQTSRFNKGIVLLFDLKRQAEGIKSWQSILDINPSATAPNGRPLAEMIKEYSVAN